MQAGHKEIEENLREIYRLLLLLARTTVVEYDLVRGLVESVTLPDVGMDTLTATLEVMGTAELGMNQTDIHPPLWLLVQHVLSGKSLSELS